MITSSISAAASSYALTASAPALVNNQSGTDSTTSDAKVDAVSKDFEAVFLSQMLEAMFSGDEFTAYFGGGTAGDVYKSELLNEYGKSIAQSGGIGIAAQVKQELLKMQETHA